MTVEELEELKSDLRAVRKAVDRHSPLYREIVATDYFARLSLPYSLLIIVFSLGTQILLGASKDYSSLPSWWLPLFEVFLFLLIVIGGALKVVYLKRRAALRGAGYLQIVQAVWGGNWIHMNLASLLAILIASLFAASLGHPWYILSACTIYFGLVLNHVGYVVRRMEYYAAGWYGVVMGSLSLFSLEAAPWLWLGLCVGGLLLVFGLGGTVFARRGERASSEVDE